MFYEEIFISYANIRLEQSISLEGGFIEALSLSVCIHAKLWQLKKKEEEKGEEGEVRDKRGGEEGKFQDPKFSSI